MLYRLLYSLLFAVVFALGIVCSLVFIRWVMTLDVHPNYIFGPFFFILGWAIFFSMLNVKK